MLSSKFKTPLKARTLSPSQHVLSPNNDDFERAQARAARAAAQRRKSFVGLEVQTSKQKPDSDKDVLSKDQILDLLQNCIKLATENKINQRNTWELRLIDHISEIVKSEEGEDTETNFQKASCTLEAGVKIYAYRVDSVHSETFKVLGGLNRTAADQEVDVDNGIDQNDDRSEAENGCRNKETQKISTSAATLESYDALNVKKFDVAFTFDPLFHQMSAQFDEGGAKGLLLNTLSVYNGCKLVFDSNDIPSKCTDADSEKDHASELTMIDLSFMKDCIQKLKVDMKVETDISPTLQQLVNMLCDPYRAAAQMEEVRESADVEINDSVYVNQTNICNREDPGDVFDEYAPDSCDDSPEHDNDVSNAGTSQDYVTWDNDIVGQEEADNQESSGFYGGISNNGNDTKHLINWITAGLDSKSNYWAGPDHWKYKKAQENNSYPEPTAKSGHKKKPKNEKFSIDFLHPPEVEMAGFAPVADQRSIMMPQGNTAVSTLLPEDCHYQPEDLVRLFLQPSVMCVNRIGKNRPEAKRAISSRAFEMMGSHWGNGDMDDNSADDGWGDENGQSDVEDPDLGEMVPQPRKVQRIEVNYDRTSKQVDVRVLKENLWESMQEKASSAQQDAAEHVVSFKSLLDRVPKTCGAAAAPSDISVHLCFICLLHLANEHGLRIQDCGTLDELLIHNITPDSGLITS